jgi:integrase
MLTLYNTAARVSKITALGRDRFEYGPSTFVQLSGKGRKHSDIPLWPNTGQVLEAWFRERSVAATLLAFPSARAQRSPHNGVDYIL